MSTTLDDVSGAASCVRGGRFARCCALPATGVAITSTRVQRCAALQPLNPNAPVLVVGGPRESSEDPSEDWNELLHVRAAQIQEYYLPGGSRHRPQR